MIQSSQDVLHRNIEEVIFMRKKSIALITAVALMAVMLLPMPVMAASGGGPLIKQVTYYNYNMDSKKYKKYSKTNYAYKNGYPVEINKTSYSGDSLTTQTVKYKMKKGKPKSAKHYNDIKRKDENWSYDSKGRLTKRVYKKSFISSEKRTYTFKYNKQGFATQYAYNEVYKYPGEKAETYNSKYRYTYTMKSGLPKQMESRYIYSDGTADTGKYVVKYNSKGLATHVQYHYSDGSVSDSSRTIKYTIKKGKVTQAVVTYMYAGKVDSKEKYTFSYTSEKVGKARYANMINAIVLEGRTAYGAYNWY